jgi:fatty acid desaturase
MKRSFDPFEISPVDDYSDAFSRVRAQLTDRRGVRLIDFVRSLTPDYRRVRRDIFLGFAALAAGLAAAGILQSSGVPFVVLVPGAALWLGYWVAYLDLFLHEGAHWGIAPDRETSDRMCNLCVGWLVLLDVKEYRKVHFQHHRALGTVEDSELSYFFPVNLMFFAKGLFGVRPFERWLSYRRQGITGSQQSNRKLVPAVGALVHLLLVVGLFSLGFTAVAAAWVIAMACIFPLLGSLRQALEHRDEKARADIDYAKVSHGAYTRLFGTGWFASTFGGAGFNRHLLHHWEPQVSYTRLGDLERFLADTPIAAVMDRRRTSYAEAFHRLFSIY